MVGCGRDGEDKSRLRSERSFTSGGGNFAFGGWPEYVMKSCEYPAQEQRLLMYLAKKVNKRVVNKQTRLDDPRISRKPRGSWSWLIDVSSWNLAKKSLIKQQAYFLFPRRGDGIRPVVLVEARSFYFFLFSKIVNPVLEIHE